MNQTVSGGNATTYTYDARGNQVFRDAPGTANDRTIAYSLDDKAHQIQMGSGQRVRFWYGPDGQRYKREEAGKITYYVGNVEMVVQGGVTTLKRNVGGLALQTVVNGAIQGTTYLFHDHLGSLVRIANPDGSVAERLDYQAFGGRRSPSDPHAAGTASAHTPRGYTGHEFVDGTGVIHMNGRLYWPTGGRMVQADPIITEIYNPQNWNPYSYVLNNPLNLTDPSGYSFFDSLLNPFKSAIRSVMRALGPEVSGALIGACSFVPGAWSIACAAGAGYDHARAFGASSSDARRSGVSAAFVATVAWGVKKYGGNLGPTSRIAIAATSGGVASVIQGGKFGHGFVSAGVTAGAAPYVSSNIVAGTAASAIIGGTVSEMTGGKFANGARSGAFAYVVGRMGERVRGGLYARHRSADGVVAGGDDVFVDISHYVKIATARCCVRNLPLGLWL